ncbi:collagen alpha-1(X) chain-like [Vidua macroura]|uniref:collagen alpha-1(X) chain-like n=1 Tax=Vidua macroura TaxID=187451 RepID=UPI0023A88D0F|nr:collagen alpha-1(X) chain-like [Vidua macroura]
MGSGGLMLHEKERDKEHQRNWQVNRGALNTSNSGAGDPLLGASGSTGDLRGRAASRGISDRRTGRERFLQPPRRLRAPGAAPARTRYRARQDVPERPLPPPPPGNPGMRSCRAVPAGLRAPAGTDTAQRARDRTQQQTKPQQPSAPRLQVPRGDTAGVPGCAGASGVGSPKHGWPRKGGEPGHRGVNPPRGHRRAPAGPAAQPSTGGHGGPPRRALPGPCRPDPPAGTPPGSPSRLPARPQRAALTCGGWGRAAPAALRSAPAPPQLRGGLAPRAPPGGAREAGPGAGPPRGRSPVMQIAYMGVTSHANTEQSPGTLGYDTSDHAGGR